MDESTIRTWSGSIRNVNSGISTIDSSYEYLATGHEIRSSDGNPVTRAEFIAVDDDRLDDVLEAIESNQSTYASQISSLSGRVTTAETGISGLDTRVTALEESGGGGSGGTTNYNELSNIPQINGVSLKGNLSAANLGLANAVDIPTVPTNVSAFNNDSGYLTEEQYTGTVTSVSVKMNGSPKGTVTSSGTIDLGTVITAHQSLDACAKTADLGDSAYKSVKNLSAKSHTGWSNYDTDSGIVPTMSFMAYWNGAYASSGSSNLSYCNKGAFGTIVTKATGDYVSSTVTSVAITDFLTTNTGYTVARSRIRKQGSQYSGWVEISGTFKANTAHIVGTTKVGSGYLYLGGCYMSDGEWSVKNIAYCCINGTGNITVGGSGSAGGTRIYIPINFII